MTRAREREATRKGLSSPTALQVFSAFFRLFTSQLLRYMTTKRLLVLKERSLKVKLSRACPAAARARPGASLAGAGGSGRTPHLRSLRPGLRARQPRTSGVGGARRRSCRKRSRARGRPSVLDLVRAAQRARPHDRGPLRERNDASGWFQLQVAQKWTKTKSTA